MLPSGYHAALLRQGRPTVRGGAAFAVCVGLAVTAGILGEATLLPLVVALGIPLAAAPMVSYKRMRRLADGATLYLRASPAMVPLGGRCELSISIASGSGNLPPCGLDSPDPRWTRLKELPPVESTAAPGRGTGTWERSRGIGFWAPPSSALVRFGALAPGSSSKTTSAVPTANRGVLGLPPLRLWTQDPFGLFGVAGPPQHPLALVVYPAPAGSTAALAAPDNPRGDDPVQTGQATASTGKDEPAELLGLRPYRVGDRLHLVHWPSLAGAGPIMVREFAPDRSQVVRIVLDDRASIHRRLAFDHALSVTHGLITEARAAGHTSDLLTLCGYRALVPPTDEGMAGVLPILATLNPRPAGSAPDGPSGVGIRWDDRWDIGPCTVVTTTTAESTLPPSVLGLGRIITV